MIVIREAPLFEIGFIVLQQIACVVSRKGGSRAVAEK